MSHFVRTRHGVQGPLDVPTIERRLRRGTLSRFHEVSSDGQDWQPIGAWLDERVEAAAAPDAAGEVTVTAPHRPIPFATMPTSHVVVATVAWTLLAVTGLIVALGGPGGPATPPPSAAEPAPEPPALPESTPTAPAPTPAPAPPPRAQVVSADTPADDLTHALGFVVDGLHVEHRGQTFVLPRASGSAFAVAPGGLLLTNAHVVESSLDWDAADTRQAAAHGYIVEPRIWVFINRREHRARVVHSAPHVDLAVLRIDQPLPIVFGLSTAPRVPREIAVRALGYPEASNAAMTRTELASELRRAAGQRHQRVRPYFRPRQFEFVLTAGVVSRTFSDDEGVVWVQHDVDIHSGNSGGPLIDSRRTVVGINTRAHRRAAGTSFALGTAQLRDQLRRFSGITWRHPR